MDGRTSGERKGLKAQGLHIVAPTQATFESQMGQETLDLYIGEQDIGRWDTWREPNQICPIYPMDQALLNSNLVHCLSWSVVLSARGQIGLQVS